MAMAVARGLRARGFARGDRIAILSVNRSEYLAAYYGIMRAGLVAVPVNYRFPAATIAFILRDCGAKLVFCDPAHRAQCPPGLPVVSFGSEGEEGFAAFLDPGPFETVAAQPDEPAMFLYTSGSTGTPKGVVLSHQSHIWVVETRLEGQDIASQRFLVAAPLYHMNALAVSAFACAGACHHRAAAAVHRARLHRSDRAPPLHLPHRRAADDRDDAARTRADRAHRSFQRAVRAHGLGAGEPEPDAGAAPRAAPGQGHQCLRHHRGGAGGVRPASARAPAARDTPSAIPIPKWRCGSVDGGDRAANQGELEMKCPAMMLGYHNRPDLPVPITADGFYRTGDVFRRDADGFHYFLGRTDDMFVSGGENIYPGDVERMLERHPGVAQACVVPIDDDIKGQKPVAFVIAKDGIAGRRRGDQALRPRQRAGLSASALRLVRRPPAALHHQQDRSRRPDASWPRSISKRRRRHDDGPGSVDRRLPAGDEIFLDHVAHFVADADAAARALALAGFTTTPQSIQVNPDASGGPPQPTGTGNVTAMLDRGYIEFLFKTADTALAKQFDIAMARYRGLHLVAFAVADAAGTHARLATAGFALQPLVDMQRPVETSEGAGIAAFSIVRPQPGEMPEGRIQALTHRTEGTVWQERWLDHRNGATGLLDVVIVEPDVGEAAARFTRFLGRPAVFDRFGESITLDRGRVQFMSSLMLAESLARARNPGAAVHLRLRRRGAVARSDRGLPRRRRHRLHAPQRLPRRRRSPRRSATDAGRSSKTPRRCRGAGRNPHRHRDGVVISSLSPSSRRISAVCSPSVGGATPG